VASPAFDRGSFRDPSSRVSVDGDRVTRALSARGAADWIAVRDSEFFRKALADGHLVATEEVSEGESTILSHLRIPFWTYPYEWSFSMLKAAALLQLDLLEAALAENLTIKDATPYNIQFVGSKPVFIDIGSFRPLEEGEPWLGYRQFCQLFLFPLLITAHTGIPFQMLLKGSLDGIEPSAARAILAGDRFKAGVLTDVFLQARADRATASRDVRSELSRAGFRKEMIVANVRRLRKIIDKTRWEESSSTWSEYAQCDHVGTQRGPKETFVRSVAAERHRSLVWDLGANDGHFSRAAAPHADTVLAVDGDALVIERLFRQLRQDGPANVTPLVVDLSNPSPGLGWMGLERRRLEDRGSPDLTLLLAVVHHLVIGSNLPLTEVMDWLRSLGGEVIFEWVPPDDPMAQKLAVNKRPWEIHPDYNEQSCRQLISARFEIRRQEALEGRVLFHLAPLK
jgi:hypothetical protein